MRLNKLGISCIGGAVLPLLVIAVVSLRDTGASGWSVGGDNAVAVRPADTVGGKRNGYLAELTQSYVTRPDARITDAMKGGRELAPIHFLNEELEQRGVRWRVRTTSGSDAVTYDVS
jgi:hypothetical protein